MLKSPKARLSFLVTSTNTFVLCFKTLLCGSFRCLENRPGSMGKPAPGFDLKVGSGVNMLSVKFRTSFNQIWHFFSFPCITVAFADEILNDLCACVSCASNKVGNQRVFFII